jgi:hypothetical protein
MLALASGQVKARAHSVLTFDPEDFDEPAYIRDYVARNGHDLFIAADTEFEGPLTLTIQFAIRVGEQIIVQVYRSPTVPDLPRDFNLKGLPGAHTKFCKDVLLRPVKVIRPNLSPAKVLADLWNVHPIRPVHRLHAEDELPEEVADPLTLTFIAHYWPADFFRVFGKDFFSKLVLAQAQGEARLIVQANKLLSFREVGKGYHRFSDPVLEHACEVGQDFRRRGDSFRSNLTAWPLKVRTFDTALPFGKGSLDTHAKSFLGISKLESISKEDKERMRETFHKKTNEAYLYAMLDPILTLLVHERMREEDHKMYVTLGFEESEIPPLRPTMGSRVAETMTKMIAKTCAAGSVKLSQKGTPLKDGGVGKVSLAKVKAILHKGSGELIAEEKLSKFGTQTAEAHGGLLFSRSPDRFFHEAPGQFRDVDLTGCYNSIISRMKMYVGRPVILEPGARRMTLKEAVTLVQEHAAGRDAWLIKVSGKITKCPNTLIYSTNQALTNANFACRRAKKRSKARRYGFVFDWLFQSRKATGNATLYTDVIEAGFVAWPTWLIIQALPEQVREEYERLEVDTILFYPDKLVARTGPEYDALVEKYGGGKTPWSMKLDMKKLRQVTVEDLDDDYVSLEFDIGSLAQTIGKLRKKAKEEHGKGCGQELAWKQHGNTMYGVCASRNLATNNVVAANIITATARALAYAMQTSLNGVQVITDGCTYRRDQVPSCTFAECLETSGEYPIHRIEDGAPFHDPEAIPENDGEFTTWYREHVKRFFGVSGPDYDELFSIHGLEHKACALTNQVAFDGLCCDGSGNYLKLLKGEDGWVVDTFKARSYSEQAKETLAPWIIDTYTRDWYIGPPPITERTSLISYKEAVSTARSALGHLSNGRSRQEHQEDPVKVLLPLGLEKRTVLAYKVIKPSGFLFRTPEQREKILKALKKFQDTYACGLELLAQRRGPHKGSLSHVATQVHDYIRAGCDNLTRELNLTRSCQELELVRSGHAQAVEKLKCKLRRRLFDTIDPANLSREAQLTGLFVSEGDIIRVE